MKNQKGFTLMEMIVAVGLFSVISVLIAQLFVIFSRTQQRSTIQQKVQSEARVVMAQISDRVRAGTIDYATYGGAIPSPTDTLYLIDENDLPVAIAQSSDSNDCPTPESTPCLVISEDGGPFTPMSTETFSVDTVQFYIDPATDPEPTGGPNIQPRVTFSMGLTPILQGTAEPFYLQTTASSRVYLR